MRKGPDHFLLVLSPGNKGHENKLPGVTEVAVGSAKGIHCV